MPYRVKRISLDLLTDTRAFFELANNIERISQRLNKLNPTLQVVAKKVQQEVIDPMLVELKTYPPPRNHNEPVDWTSEKQQRYVMMLWRKKHIKLPTERTGALGAAWHGVTEVQGRKLRIHIYNNHPATQFVVGRIGVGKSKTSQRRYLKPQQRFHRKTGWRSASAIVQIGYEKANRLIWEYFNQFLDTLIDGVDEGLS